MKKPFLLGDILVRKRAVFLDRDGVITQDPPHYAHRLDQLQIIKGSAEAIRLLNTHDFLVIVVTNQSGVARGYFQETDVTIFNTGMTRLLEEAGAHVDAIYYCPHHPEASVEAYKLECTCRKPHPGMILAGLQKFSLEPRNSFIIGDKWSDIEAGTIAGLQTILVLTGHGKKEITKKAASGANYVAANLLDAVNHYILPTE